MVMVAPENVMPDPPRDGTYGMTVGDYSAADQANIALMVSQGTTGLKQWYGRVYEEWLPELQSERGRLTYRQIMDNDPTVGAMFNGIEMILRGVNFYVDPFDDSDIAKKRAEHVDSSMKDMNDQSWHDFMCEAARGALGYGWSYWEIEYKRRLGFEPPQPEPTPDDPYPFVPPSKHDDGYFGWYKFGIRGQDSLWRWEFSPTQRLVGMWQLPPPDYQLRFIDYEKAVLFRLYTQKESPEGRSALRNAYRPWFFKQHFETIEGIGVERDLAGLPVFWGPPELLSAHPSDEMAHLLSAAQNMVRNIRRDEQEGIIMPLMLDAAGHKLYDLTLLSSGGTRQFDTDAVISRYDQRIAMTMLADFLLLGHESSGNGSYAQVKSRTSLWIMAFNALLVMLCHEINTKAIPKLMRANGWDVKQSPSLKYSDIKSLSVQEMGQLLQMLSQAGFPVGRDKAAYTYIMSEAAIPTDGASVVYEAEQTSMEQQAAASAPFGPTAGNFGAPGASGGQQKPGGAKPPAKNGQRPQQPQNPASREQTKQGKRETE